MTTQKKSNNLLESFQNRIFQNILVRSNRIFKSLTQSKPLNNSLGNYVAFLALGRLDQSIRACVILLRRRHGFEAIAVMRQIFEQFAWISFIYNKSEKKSIYRPPQGCIKSFIDSFPMGGRFYGALSEVGHMHPRFIKSYLSEEHFEKEVRISVVRTSIAEVAQYSIILLFFVGLYGLVSEMISAPQSCFLYLDNSGNHQEISTKFLKVCAKYQSRLDKLMKYVSNPPELKLVYSKENNL
jgi:hypothetical protein